MICNDLIGLMKSYSLWQALIVLFSDSIMHLTFECRLSLWCTPIVQKFGVDFVQKTTLTYLRLLNNSVFLAFIGYIVKFRESMGAFVYWYSV